MKDSRGDRGSNKGMGVGAGVNPNTYVLSGTSGGGYYKAHLQ